MFKFTIEAESLEMLATKMNHWAQIHASQNHELKQQVITQKAVDTILDKVTTQLEQPETTVVNAGDDLDVRGLPYDSRIHSAGKSKNQDGTWRYRRGIDETIIEKVENEIKSIASPLQTSMIPPVPVSSAPAMPVMPEVPMAPPMMSVPVMPTLNPPDQTQTPEVKRHPDAPAFASPSVDKIYDAFTNVDNGIVIPPGMKPAHTLQTFTNGLTEILAQLINEKKIDKAYIESLCKHFNVKYIWNVIGSGNQIKELYEAFAQYGFITKLD